MHLDPELSKRQLYFKTQLVKSHIHCFVKAFVRSVLIKEQRRFLLYNYTSFRQELK